MSDDDSPLLPIRPVEPVDEDIVADIDPAFEHPEDAGVDVVKGEDRIDAEELICGPNADDDSVVKPQLFSEPESSE